jgi:hypothetical protein
MYNNSGEKVHILQLVLKVVTTTIHNETNLVLSQYPVWQYSAFATTFLVVAITSFSCNNSYDYRNAQNKWQKCAYTTTTLKIVAITNTYCYNFSVVAISEVALG